MMYILDEGLNTIPYQELIKCDCGASFYHSNNRKKIICNNCWGESHIFNLRAHWILVQWKLEKLDLTSASKEVIENLERQWKIHRHKIEKHWHYMVEIET